MSEDNIRADIFNDFTLVGGTCLSFKLGHRCLVDIDLFTSIGYGSMNTSAIKSFLSENFPYTENLETFGQPAFGNSVRIGNSPYKCIKVDFIKI